MTSLPGRLRERARRELEARRRARHDARIDAAASSMPRPPAPAAVQTNIGPEMDGLINRAMANQLPPGLDPDYDLLREHFDYRHFLLQALILHERPEVDPIRFFLRNGAEAINSPDINFSVPNYIERHPEVLDGPERSPYLHWLKHGRAAGHIADPAFGIDELAPMLGLTPAQVVEELVALRTDVHDRIRNGKLGEMFAKAAEIEPLVGGAWPEVARTRLVPFGAKVVARQMKIIHDAHRAAGFRRPRLVIVTDGPGEGVGRGMASHLSYGLGGSVAPEDVVVIYTDRGGRAAVGELPDGVHEIDLATPIFGMFEDPRQRTLVALLRSLQAEVIVNVDSEMFYDTLIPFGRALAASERIFLAMFGSEQTAIGTWEGSSLSSFYALFPFVSGVVTDSAYVRDELARRYQIPAADLERIHVLPAPARPEIPLATAPSRSTRPTVFWAGRWERRQRVDLAIKVAERMPEVDFRILGESQPTGSLGRLPENVRLLPHRTRLEEADFDQADAWLYTSSWDGVPSLLLEVAMTGVPIVASGVGGVMEILGECGGWPVEHWREPDAYVAALRAVFADPEGARARARDLRERLLSERPASAYGGLAASVLLPEDAGHEQTDRKEDER